MKIDPATLPSEIKRAAPARAPSAQSNPSNLRFAPVAPLAQAYGDEVEPNGTSANATPIAETNSVVRGSVFPNADVDFYSFSAAAGDKV